MTSRLQAAVEEYAREMAKLERDGASGVGLRVWGKEAKRRVLRVLDEELEAALARERDAMRRT